ncbi:hypothetical protein F4861DRAFT_545901 [Xylaria intraflava]|nr:hypothetical protein F4861DRAFT_545901 [Xylaria intraflava]
MLAGAILSLLSLVGASPVTIVERGIIPVHKIGCYPDVINEADITLARLKLQIWGRTHKVGLGMYHGEKYNESAVWVCNCKHFYKDHIVEEELDEARELIKGECGEIVAGWVWSKKWQKSWNYGTAEEMDSDYYGDKCPQFCVWSY